MATQVKSPPAKPAKAPAKEPEAPRSTANDNEPGCEAGRVFRRRSDNDVLSGEFCRVISGDHTGRYGVFETIGSLGKNGWPKIVVVKTRDDQDERIHVAYSDIRPDTAGKR